MRTAAFKGDKEFLSNFHPVPHGIFYNGIKYPSIEHAFVAAKLSPEERETNVNWQRLPDMTAGSAKREGRKFKLRPNWNEMRLSVMKELLIQKFAQGELRTLLLNTKDEYLEETNYWNDKFWGVCDGEGANHLGRLLMEVRHMIGGPVPPTVLPKVPSKLPELPGFGFGS